MAVSGKFPSDNTSYEIKCLATKHMDFIRSPEGKKKNPFRIFVESILPERTGIPPEDIVDRQMCDFNMLVFDLYRATYGDKIIFKTNCEECGFSEQREADLSQADIQVANPDTPSTGLEFLYDGTKIRWHLSTIRDQMEALDDVERLKEQGSANIETSILAAAAIDDIGGVTDDETNGVMKRRRIWAWVSDTSIDFLTDFQLEMDDLMAGPDLVLDVTCTKCGEEYSDDLPLLSAFFQRGRMAKQRKRKKIRTVRPALFSIRSESFSPSTP